MHGHHCWPFVRGIHRWPPQRVSNAENQIRRNRPKNRFIIHPNDFSFPDVFCAERQRCEKTPHLIFKSCILPVNVFLPILKIRRHFWPFVKESIGHLITTGSVVSSCDIFLVASLWQWQLCVTIVMETTFSSHFPLPTKIIAQARAAQLLQYVLNIVPIASWQNLLSVKFNPVESIKGEELRCCLF